MKSETSELQEVCARLQELEAQYRTLTAQTRLKGVLSVTLASALSSLVAVLVVVGLNATAAGAQVRNEAAMPAQAIPLEGTDRFRVSIDPVGGHLVVSVLDDTKKNFLPILQFKGDLLHGPSALGAPQIWTKMFLQSPGTGLGHEFVEFRAGGDYPQGGQGIGGFLYRTVGQQLVEWAENWKGLAFATMSTSEQTVGTLGTIRLAIGADSTVEDVPITISDAFLIFDSGTVDPGEQPNISVKHTDSLLTVAGGPSDGNAASLSLHGTNHPELPGAAVLSTPDGLGGHQAQSVARITVTAGADAAINLNAPAHATAGLVVPDGQYLRLAHFDTSAPPADDCDSDAERGRMGVSAEPHRLYVCQGAARGWDYVLLMD